MRPLRLGCFAVLAASAFLVTGLALAQTPIDRATPLPAFGRSAVSVEDSSSLVLNPANLALQPDWEFRWQAVFLDDRALVPWQGHAFSFSAPISFLNMGVGLRVDLVDPPEDAPDARYGVRSNYQWITGALAWSPSRAGALGFSFQHAYSENDDIDGWNSWSLGYTARPVNQLGMAVVLHDINAPTNDQGGKLERSYDLAVAVRPVASRALEIGLEGKYIDAYNPYWVPRATLGIDIPSLGRLRGEFSVSDPDERAGERAWLASAQMAFAFNQLGGSLEMAGGSVFGSGLGDAADSQAYKNIITDVAFRGFREHSAAEPPYHALRVRIEDTPGTREHFSLLRRLWEIAETEPRVAAVVLELRDAPASSLARVAELRDAIWYLRKSGKRVICHLEDADGASLYLCSAASRILLNPAGGIRFAGLRTRYYYVKSLLDKLGIKADFVKIGAHKSAPEMFTRDSASDVARADKIDLLNQFERHFVAGVAAGRRITPDTLRQRIAKGPFIATEARTAGLVDGFAFDDEIEAEVGRQVGFPLKVRDDDHRAERAPRDFGTARGIAVVYVDGDMVDGRSQSIPLIGIKMAGSYTIAESLKAVREDEGIGAVILRVETGGGSAMAADVIWREVQLTARVKPIVVSMGSAAASGGYYISTPATRIFANPLSITGSIGIFYGKADVSELLGKIGVNVETYKTAPRADAESIFRPYTADERTELERKVGQFYDMFLGRVAEGRRLTKQQVDAVGQGRVWTGEQALQRKLVDEIGGMRQALAAVRKLANLSETAPIVQLPVESSLLGTIIGAAGAQTKVPTILPAQLIELARAVAPFAFHPSDAPLAKMELVEAGQ